MTGYLWQRAAILAVAIVLGWIIGSFFWGLAVGLSLFFLLTVGWSFVAPWIDRKESQQNRERHRRF
jgi:hypothetical protein